MAIFNDKMPRKFFPTTQRGCATKLASKSNQYVSSLLIMAQTALRTTKQEHEAN